MQAQKSIYRLDMIYTHHIYALSLHYQHPKKSIPIKYDSLMGIFKYILLFGKPEAFIEKEMIYVVAITLQSPFII